MTVTIGRRELLAALGGAAAAWPLAVRAEQEPMPVIGLVINGAPDIYAEMLAAPRPEDQSRIHLKRKLTVFLRLTKRRNPVL